VLRLRSSDRGSRFCGDEVPGQQVSDPVHRMIGDPRQNLTQVCLGIHSIEFRRTDQAINGGRTLASQVGTSEQVIFPTQCDHAQGTFRRVGRFPNGRRHSNASAPATVRAHSEWPPSYPTCGIAWAAKPRTIRAVTRSKVATVLYELVAVRRVVVHESLAQPHTKLRFVPEPRPRWASHALAASHGRADVEMLRVVLECLAR
jgi:hypothetical protein